MSLSMRPQNWTSYGPIHFPFYFAKELPRMNHLNAFHWVQAEGDENIHPSDKHLDFVVAGSPIDITKGRVERYVIDIAEYNVSANSLKIEPNAEYNYDYPVLNAQIANNIMAVRTIESTIHINKLNQPSAISKFKFPEQFKQNSNRTLAWNSNGDTILAGSHSKNVYLYDLSCQKTKSFNTHYSKDITDIVWLDNKYFATASFGGKILMYLLSIFRWSISESKPIYGFTDGTHTHLTSPTSLALVKKGPSIEDLTLLSATGRVATLWNRKTQQKSTFSNHHQAQITKLNFKGVVNNDRLFASLDKNGTIVTYEKNEEASAYTSSFLANDFDCMNGFYGIVSQSRCFAIWMPRVNKKYEAVKLSSKGK